MLTIVRAGCLAVLCAAALVPAAVAADSPLGLTFELTKHNSQPPREGVTQTMTLGKDGSLHGNSGCNTYRAGFVTMGEAILIQPAAVTRMACPEPQMNAEYSFFSTLAAVTSFTYDDATGILTLQSAAGRPLMELKRQDP